MNRRSGFCLLTVVTSATLLFFCSEESAKAQTVTTVNIGAQTPGPIAVNPMTNNAYVATFAPAGIGSASTIVVITGTTNSTAPISLSETVQDVAVNSVTNTIYVAGCGDLACDGYVAVIDGATNNVNWLSVGWRPVGVVVNQYTNTTYVKTYNTITVIDGLTNNTTTIGVGNGYGPPPPPSWDSHRPLAVNQVTNKVYVANWNDDTVTVIDGMSNATTTIPGITSPDSIAVNSVTDKVYVTSSTGGLTVIDGDTDAVIATIGGPYSYAVATNEVTDQIYVANQGCACISVVDGDSYLVSDINTASQASAIAVDSVANKIYVSNTASNNLTVIDGTSNQTSTIDVGVQPNAIAINSASGAAYVVNVCGNDPDCGSSSTVSIVGASSTPPAVTLAPSYIAFSGQGNTFLTIMNSGGSTLSLTDKPSIIGFNAGDFSVANDTTCVAGAAIPAGNSCIVDIVFTPTTESWETATLTVYDNASYRPQTVPLSGGGQLMSISPNPVSGSTSPQTIIITGTNFVDGAKINWQDLTASPWTGTVEPETVSPSAITASIDFKGSSAIWQIAVVNPGQAKTSPSRTSNLYAFQVIGIGAAAPSFLDDYPYKNEPVDSLDPYDFASDECTSYVAWRINRDNGTTDPANPSFFKTMEGGNWSNANNWGINAVFLKYSSDPKSSPRVGDIAQWIGLNHVAYVERVGNPDGSIDVSEYNYGYDDGGIKYEYGLRNVPTTAFPDEFIHISRLTLDPTSLDFGSNAAGTSSSQVVEVTNSQAQAISFPSSGVTVGASETGIGTGSFAESDTCSGKSIASGEQCQVTVTFMPSRTLTQGGIESAAIVLNWGLGPQLIPVKGIALTNLNPSTESLSFGNVPVGNGSVAENVKLTNKTGASVAISSISTGSSQFSASGCTSVLPNGGSCTVSVAFAPTAKGKQTATLTIIDSAVNSPQTVSLKGNGI